VKDFTVNSSPTTQKLNLFAYGYDGIPSQYLQEIEAFVQLSPLHCLGNRSGTGIASYDAVNECLRQSVSLVHP
jgi:hypothetical protein